MSFTEPQSVEVILSICPVVMSTRAFFGFQDREGAVQAASVQFFVEIHNVISIIVFEFIAAGVSQ